MNKYLTILLIMVAIASVKSDSKIKDLVQCFSNVKDTVFDLKNIISDLQKLDFQVAFQQLGDLLKVVDQSIGQCVDATCWMSGEQRCQADNSNGCEESGLIWYPKCKQGYHPFGCCVCVQDCPSGFRDDGLFCAKPESYGRGAGYPWKFGDGFNLNGAYSRCKSENPQGCEKWGEIIYPKCAQNFHNVGCCVCSPNCPSEMTDIGVSCQKLSYGRGLGYVSGKCIQENWNIYTPISQFGKCKDQAQQIEKDILDLQSSFDAQNDDHRWSTLKIAYHLLQHLNPFLSHCADHLVNGLEEKD